MKKIFLIVKTAGGEAEIVSIDCVDEKTIRKQFVHVGIELVLISNKVMLILV